MWIEQNEHVRAQPREATICATRRPRIGLVSTVGCGTRELVEVGQQRPHRRHHQLAAVDVRDPLDVAPVAAEPDQVAQLEQRQLALEAHDAVELRDRARASRRG